MKKIIGLLAVGSLCMFAACSSGDDDNSITPPTNSDNGGVTPNPSSDAGTQVTPEVCQAAGKILSVDPVTGALYCADPAPSASSQTGTTDFGTNPDPSQTSQQPGITPVPTTTSSSSPGATPTATSSSSVASSPATQTPKSSPATQTTPAEESDGKWHLALWDGTADAPQVPTGNKTGGYWYSYTDKNDNGLSTLTWDAADDGTSEEGLVPVIKECHGLCGSFNLLAGTNKYKPYVGVGFNYSRSANEVADATPSRGVCVTYTSDIEIILEMGLGSKDSQIGYANPFVTLPAATSPKTMDFSWSEFQQPTWTETKNIVSNPEGALASLKFKFAGEQDSTDGGAGKFNIMKVGAPDECR